MKRARNPVAQAFFEGQFASWPREFIETSISPVLNKVEAFTVNQKIRNVLGQSHSKLHFEHALRRGRIVIAKLAKGTVGDKPAFLMGCRHWRAHSRPSWPASVTRPIGALSTSSSTRRRILASE